MRKIHLRLADQENFLKRVNKKERFELLVSLGSKTYHFSNRQKAERFMNQFSKYITDSYRFYLQSYSDVNSSFSVLFPYCQKHVTFKIKEILRSVLDVFDLAFSDSHIRDNTVLINWIFWLEENLSKVCNLLKSVARNSRNQTEFSKVSIYQSAIQFQGISFFNRYKNFEYKGKVSSPECEIVTLYNPLQLAINF